MLRLWLVLGVVASLSLSVSAHAGDCKRDDRRAALRERFDRDGDGKVDDQERALAREGLERKKAKRRARFDANKDGKLDDAERKAARRERIAAFDTNKDGELDDAERAAARAAR